MDFFLFTSLRCVAVPYAHCSIHAHFIWCYWCWFPCWYCCWRSFQLCQRCQHSISHSPIGINESIRGHFTSFHSFALILFCTSPPPPFLHFNSLTYSCIFLCVDMLECARARFAFSLFPFTRAAYSVPSLCDKCECNSFVWNNFRLILIRMLFRETPSIPTMRALFFIRSILLRSIYLFFRSFVRSFVCSLVCSLNLPFFLPCTRCSSPSKLITIQVKGIAKIKDTWVTPHTLHPSSTRSR